MIEASKKLHIVADEILEALTKKKDQGEIHGFSLDIQTMVRVPFVGILQIEKNDNHLCAQKDNDDQSRVAQKFLFTCVGNTEYGFH